MKEVTKAEFKELYFRCGGGSKAGWGPDYWDEFFQAEEGAGRKYMVEEPATEEHNRMCIVSDSESKEYRMFFLTEEGEEHFLEFPGES